MQIDCLLKRGLLTGSLMRFWVGLFTILALIACDIGAPAIASQHPTGQSVELIETNSSAVELADQNDSERSPASLGDHADHHHCWAVQFDAPLVAANAQFTNGGFLIRPVYGLTSHQTAPPTEPPAA
jgi:hypothetical protein